jgi:hypothetical protein
MESPRVAPLNEDSAIFPDEVPATPLAELPSVPPSSAFTLDSETAAASNGRDRHTSSKWRYNFAFVCGETSSFAIALHIATS